MSVVTGVFITMSLLDWEDTDTPSIHHEINRWLKEHHFGEMQERSDGGDGNKHPQFSLMHAGFNHFPAEDFAEFFKSLPWADPERAVLVLQPEDGAAEVFRPKH